ncbi:very short patch repair endonuclease [Pontibacter flavimaris]|uniref:Very short patch repair endonuclease n=1 Tax=Pontibacter flavimaris TaxID=1797110 RepID=A0A1Q5P9I6_9BACT|nr:very short patch repair endonuclease [Pontibacter flavimaris]OKL38887.1 very short patch repair endonuclease [Pontibacter flavimaris]
MPKKRKYKRPQPPLTAQEKVSRCMRGNKAKDTQPELKLRRALWQAGLRGYRVHWPKAPGKPDICDPARRLAVFVHGCFWHRCPYCQPALPKTNAAFWQHKLEANVKRDAKYRRMYREAGWQRLVVWECQLKQGQQSIVSLIRELHSGVPESWEVAA